MSYLVMDVPVLLFNLRNYIYRNNNVSTYSLGNTITNFTINNNTNNNDNIDYDITRVDQEASKRLDDHVYSTIGVFMTLLIFFGFLENSVVLYVYAKNRTLRTHKNAFLIGLAVDDLAQSILNIPFVCVSAFNHEWAFGQDMCQFYAFITCLLGLTQITILTVIALDRYLLIIHQKRVFSDSLRAATCTLIACFVNGALWASGPLIGWSRYKMEAGNVSCGVDWNLKEAGNLSYVASMFVCLWFLPLAVLIYSYNYIIHRLFRERKRRSFVIARKDAGSSREKKVAVTCLIMTGFFVITWLPYSVVSLWSALGDISTIPVPAQMSTAFVAKSAIIWNPIIYFLRHSHFRSACADSISWIRFVLKVTETGNSSSAGGGGVSRKNDTNMTELTPRSAPLVRKARPKLQMSPNSRESVLLSQDRHSVQVSPDRPSIQLSPNRTSLQTPQQRQELQMTRTRRSLDLSQKRYVVRLSDGGRILSLSQKRIIKNTLIEQSQIRFTNSDTAQLQTTRNTETVHPQKSTPRERLEQSREYFAVAMWNLSHWTTPLTTREMSQMISGARETIV